MRYSFADLHLLYVAFNGDDWMANKLLGELSVEAAVIWAETFGYTLLNWTPWGFWYSPIAVEPDGAKIARLYIDEDTTHDKFLGFDWVSKINYIMTVHVINSQFILRLQNEVRVLAGNTKRGRPLKHQP